MHLQVEVDPRTHFYQKYSFSLNKKPFLVSIVNIQNKKR